MFPVENRCSSMRVRLQEVKTGILRIQVIDMNSIYIAQYDYIHVINKLRTIITLFKKAVLSCYIFRMLSVSMCVCDSMRFTLNKFDSHDFLLSDLWNTH